MKNEKFYDLNTKEMPHLWGNIIFCVLRVIMCVFRLNHKNRESIRAFHGKTGLVMISNHTSFLDTICQYLVLRLKQWPRFIGRESLFYNKFLAFLLTRCGVFPIKRDSADRRAIKRAVSILKDKGIVGIMPEGTRRGKSGKKPTLHAGAAFIARMGGNVPILPATTINAEKIKEKGKFVRFPKVTVAFGTPILVTDFDFLPKEDRLEGCTWYAMRESFALFKGCKPEEVDMVDLFPDTKDYSKIFKEHPIPKHTSEEIVKGLS